MARKLGEQLPLFEEPAPPPRAARPARRRTRKNGVRWSRYRGERVPCEDCFAELVAAGGDGPALPPGVWRRVTEDSVRLLCVGHKRAQQLRDEEPAPHQPERKSHA